MDPPDGAGPALLLGAGALLLAATVAALLWGHPVAGTALASGAWLSIGLGVMLPGRPERAGLDLGRRIDTFRAEIGAAGEEPVRGELERLLQRARDLQLPESDIADDLAGLRASLAALDLRDQLRAGAWPLAVSPDPLPFGDSCHFVCPVRFGRRRADQYGHLVLTRRWLTFRGALDMSVAWSEVVVVERAGREVIVGLQASQRIMRFACHTLDEAARAGVIASELSRAAARVPMQYGAAAYDVV